MSTDIKRAPGTTQEQDASRVVRLSVNLAPSVADALKSVAADQGISLTEATRRAVALLKLANDARNDDKRLMVVEGQGEKAIYREIVML
ncbi:hypothetical protein [Sanguibacter suarezii]|uniref:hypothetical protein n=1 Tax=Sanguibacter suarezii TaxID=60921 RepID=UPI000834CA4F|nr:hypothetical protein [Sanguibacter suarezii]